MFSDPTLAIHSFHSEGILCSQSLTLATNRENVISFGVGVGVRTAAPPRPLPPRCLKIPTILILGGSNNLFDWWGITSLPARIVQKSWLLFETKHFLQNYLPLCIFQPTRFQWCWSLFPLLLSSLTWSAVVWDSWEEKRGGTKLLLRKSRYLQRGARTGWTGLTVLEDVWSRVKSGRMGFFLISCTPDRSRWAEQAKVTGSYMFSTVQSPPED